MSELQIVLILQDNVFEIIQICLLEVARSRCNCYERPYTGINLEDFICRDNAAHTVMSSEKENA